MSQCANCLLDFDLYPTVGDGFCPNCGRKDISAFAAAAPNQPKTPPVVPTTERQPTTPQLAPIGPGSTMVLVGRFWATIRDIILRPAQFFSSNAQSLVSEGGLSTALAFAVIVQWLAAFFNFVWRSTLGVLLESRMSDLAMIAGDVMESGPLMSQGIGDFRNQAYEFVFGAGAIILTPFTTLIKLALVGLLVHAAVRFFMKETTDRPHSYSTTLKILAYASAPWILCIIPGLGVLLAWILVFVAAVAGLREVYQSTTGRAVLAVIFPELIFFGLMTLFVLIMLFLAFNVMRLVF